MKRFVKSMFGFVMATIVINSCWSFFPEIFGVKGGWISALVFTGGMWYLNHYKGIIHNEQDAAFVDMGLAIGLSLIVRDLIKNGSQGMQSSLPTLLCVCIGGILAGIVGGYIQKFKNRGNE